MSLASIDAYHRWEEARSCAAGNHKFGGWREDDDGRSYWNCLRDACEHQHRNDPHTPEEIAHEADCQTYQRYQEVLAERARRPRSGQAGEHNDDETK